MILWKGFKIVFVWDFAALKAYLLSQKISFILSCLQILKHKRDTFESNLEQEGLILNRERHIETGLNFVKISAPDEVLKRYAEILNLR